MNIEDVQRRVKEIEDLLPDDETAHEKEGQLYEDFITHVAISGNDEFSAMAYECLKTKKIKFSRWYA